MDHTLVGRVSMFETSVGRIRCQALFSSLTQLLQQENATTRLVSHSDCLKVYVLITHLSNLSCQNYKDAQKGKQLLEKRKRHNMMQAFYSAFEYLSAFLTQVV